MKVLNNIGLKRINTEYLLGSKSSLRPINVPEPALAGYLSFHFSSFHLNCDVLVLLATRRNQISGPPGYRVQHNALLFT